MHSGRNHKTKVLTSLHHHLAGWLSGFINNSFGFLVFGYNRRHTATLFTSQGYKTTQIHFVEYLLFPLCWASSWGRRNIKQRQCSGKRHWFGNQTGNHFRDVEFKPLRWDRHVSSWHSAVPGKWKVLELFTYIILNNSHITLTSILLFPFHTWGKWSWERYNWEEWDQHSGYLNDLCYKKYITKITQISTYTVKPWASL